MPEISKPLFYVTQGSSGNYFLLQHTDKTVANWIDKNEDIFTFLTLFGDRHLNPAASSVILNTIKYSLMSLEFACKRLRIFKIVT